MVGKLLLCQHPWQVQRNTLSFYICLLLFFKLWWHSNCWRMRRICRRNKMRIRLPYAWWPVYAMWTKQELKRHRCQIRSLLQVQRSICRRIWSGSGPHYIHGSSSPLSSVHFFFSPSPHFWSCFESQKVSLTSINFQPNFIPSGKTSLKCESELLEWVIWGIQLRLAGFSSLFRATRKEVGLWFMVLPWTLQNEHRPSIHPSIHGTSLGRYEWRATKGSWVRFWGHLQWPSWGTCCLGSQKICPIQQQNQMDSLINISLIQLYF